MTARPAGVERSGDLLTPSVAALPVAGPPIMIPAARLRFSGAHVDDNGHLSRRGEAALWSTLASLPIGVRFTLDPGACRWPSWEALQIIRRELSPGARFILEGDVSWFAMWERVCADPEPRLAGA